MNIFDTIREEEERSAAAERALIASELAAYRALPAEERQRIEAERTAKLVAFFDAPDSEDEDEED